MRFKTNLKVEKGRLDMTPLIDVVFQLIIFFMLSSSFVLQPGIKVELPSVKLPGSEKPSGLSVVVRRDGKIFFEDREIKLKDLSQRLREVPSKDLLIIKADEKAEHGTVVQVMSEAKESGISRIAIATKPKWGERQP
ncbi:MAG: biopolymer transporter ExbD [Chlamydiae bacterium]|nr:biopolymer transporter ExbD [Chlamydiota bacterium]MBI3266146.1 biopolymer transporter ExbD [Chlamydiota bacterium]